MYITTSHYTLNPVCRWRRTARSRLIIPVQKIALHKNRTFQLKATSRYEIKNWNFWNSVHFHKTAKAERTVQPIKHDSFYALILRTEISVFRERAHNIARLTTRVCAKLKYNICSSFVWNCGLCFTSWHVDVRVEMDWEQNSITKAKKWGIFLEIKDYNKIKRKRL